VQKSRDDSRAAPCRCDGTPLNETAPSDDVKLLSPANFSTNVHEKTVISVNYYYKFSTSCMSQ